MSAMQDFVIEFNLNIITAKVVCLINFNPIQDSGEQIWP